MTDPDKGVLRFEFRNTRPVDLMDLTASLAAFGDAYQDYVVRAGHDVERGNVRLFIREIHTGSIITEQASYADQASFVLDHLDVAAGFVTHFVDVASYFLGLPSKEEPTRRDAEQAMAIMEPVAKDGGSQLFLNVLGDVHVHHHYDSQQANAIQNGARRYLGPALPTSQVYQDQLLVLHQVRGDAASKVGDRGVIEAIDPTPAKLLFASEQVKAQIVDQPENPFQKIFLVDVEARAAEGKVRLYRILAVKDVIDRV
jgi:energy-converting hydrogenase Eha subunit A